MANEEIDTEQNEDWLSKCITCKHCYTTNDDDYIKCRKRNGKCEYKEYKPTIIEVDKADKGDNE